MKFKLSRHTVSPEMGKIILREMRRQKLDVPKITRKELRELVEICKEIEGSGLPANLVCLSLESNLGKGIFLRPSASPIKKGTVIGSYAGEASFIAQNRTDDGSYAFTPVEDMLLSKQEQQFFDKGASYSPRRLYSFKVDGFKKGNFTRYINHSEKPNLIAYTLAVPSNSYGLHPSSIEVIYFAKKTIHPGEQLLVSYEDGDKCYWGAQSQKPFVMTPKTFRVSAKGIVFNSQTDS
jgi:SET domain